MTKYRFSSARYRTLLLGSMTVSSLALVGCDGEEKKKAPPQAATPRNYGETPTGQPGTPAKPQVDPEQVLAAAKPLFSPLDSEAPKEGNPWTKEKADLGRMLYYDARLSKNHDVSCNTCHDLANFGVDIREEGGKRIPTSLGHKGQKGDRNSPTVYNAAFHLAQFWDGRAEDVEAQAKGPVLNPVEMAMPDEASVLATLRSVPGYAPLFTAAFPGQAPAITYDNMAKAIGAFERELLTPAPFDAFVDGDLQALTTRQAYGLQLFLDVGCTECHAGALIGGNQYQKLGTTKPWPNLEDRGRVEITHDERDLHVFKVPSLRNVTQTGPYMHDGSVSSLREMVSMMAEHQTARGALDDEDAEAIVAFLETLKGSIPPALIAKPQLPPSGPTTPKPDPS